MTLTKFNTILADLGMASPSGWFRFPSDASMICLANDMKEYIKPGTYYKLDSAKNALLASYGNPDSGEISGDDYFVNSIYNIEYIDYVVCTSFVGPIGSFYSKPIN